MSTRRWLGNAASVTDLWTVSLSGTVTSQTYTFTVNGKTVTYTSSGGDTVATILAAFVVAWNTTSNPPEFLELLAAPVPSTGAATSMTITQNTTGVPSVITVATGGAATFSITNTTAATGPNFFTNAQNWSGGVAPANSDTLVFDNGSVDCCFAISTSLTGIVLNINPGYSGKIGLPLINSPNAVTYNEYRTTNLTFAGGTVVINCPTLQQCNLAFGANTTSIRVLQTSTQRLSAYIPIVLITGGNGSSEVDISRGDVSTAFYQGSTANFPVIKTSFVSNALTDVSLVCGVGSTLGAITKNGGILIVSANVTTITQTAGGGITTLADSVTATTINSYAGTVNINTIGTVGTINLYGAATLTCDNDPRGKTLTNPINVFDPRVTIIDNQKSLNSGTLSLATNGCASVNVQHGGNASIVYT